MNVLVIPEDFRHDQYVLRPIVEAMLRHIGPAQVKVQVCQAPRLGSVEQALRWERIREIVNRYKGMVDLFLLCVDRDGEPGRRSALDQIEAKATSVLPAGRALLAENAWQEIEVWLLAGHHLPHDWDWRAIRSEVHPKERYFLPLAASRRLLDEPGQGRRTLGREAAQRYQRVRSLCPEDVAALENRIRDWLGGDK